MTEDGPALASVSTQEIVECLHSVIKVCRVNMPEIEGAALSAEGMHAPDAIVEISTRIFCHHFSCFLCLLSLPHEK
jgi:hypothetical protein